MLCDALLILGLHVCCRSSTAHDLSEAEDGVPCKAIAKPQPPNMPRFKVEAIWMGPLVRDRMKEYVDTYVTAPNLRLLPTSLSFEVGKDFPAS